MSDPAGKNIQSVTRNALGQLVVKMLGGNGPIVDARVARCFPWSRPDEYVSVRDKDGKELMLLHTLGELDDASRQLVEQELHDKIFKPRIEQIVTLKTEFDVTTITARTDRGEVSFQIRGRDDVRVLSGSRMLLKDVDGNTYDLPDVSRLDRRSQKWLEQFL